MEEILVYGASWCPDCRRAKKFLADQRVSYGWHDIESDPDGVKVVQDRNDGKNIIPTIIFRTGPISPSPRTRSWPRTWGFSVRRCCTSTT
jgi:thioredoxin reductase (NADPH)